MAFLQRHRVTAVLLVLGVVVVSLVGWRIKKQQAAAVPRRQVEIVVGVVKPLRKDLELKIAYSADVIPNRQVAIFSKVSGYIKRLGADLGDYVRAGQLLVEVDALELNAAVGTAEANVQVAESLLVAARANAVNQEANLVRARAVGDNDTRNAQRLEDLHGRGLISQMDRDNARTNAESSRAALAAAEAQLAVARSQIETQRSQVTLARANIERERAALKIAQTNLDNTRITAPFPGWISARNLHPGAAVSSQAAGTSNSSVGILMLQDLDPVKVQVEIEARHIALVRVGSVARVTVDAYPGRTFEARAVRILQALDPRSRTLGVEMEIPNRELLLKPGLYARVELITGHHPNALLLPNEAIAVDGDASAVFVVTDGIVSRRPVTTGTGEGTLVEITQGLTGDELVITEGKELTREGLRVRAELKK